MDKYKKLIEQYPYLFSTNEMEPIVLFGIECSEGWYHIIEAVCINISRRYRSALSSVNYFKEKIENKKFDEFFTEQKAIECLTGSMIKLQEYEKDLPKFEQIKEKFGTLRMYTDKSDPYISGVIDMAETMSAITCERCGALGKTYTMGWHSTLCPEHAKERYGEKILDLESNN